jgi:PDZ domain-containing secreted protein
MRLLLPVVLIETVLMCRAYPGLAEAGFEIVHSVRSLKYDVNVDVTMVKVTGASFGVVLALNLLQSMTNCFFNDEVRPCCPLV